MFWGEGRDRLDAVGEEQHLDRQDQPDRFPIPATDARKPALSCRRRESCFDWSRGRVHVSVVTKEAASVEREPILKVDCFADLRQQEFFPRGAGDFHRCRAVDLDRRKSIVAKRSLVSSAMSFISEVSAVSPE